MNKERRNKINKAVKIIETQLDELRNCLLDEEMAFDSLSEGLQQTARGEEMEECIEILEETIDKIEESCEELKDI